MSTILVLHGPNLNMLGTREPEVYGYETLADIDDRLRSLAAEHGHHLLHLQSNAEYELIERVHEARAEGVDFIIINPAAFTLYSMAVMDALKMVSAPVIELHISNIHTRGPRYSDSLMSEVVTAIVAGLGARGYPLAVRALIDMDADRA